jgi:raffinose/stachyose/melibiose transport system permease protein
MEKMLRDAKTILLLAGPALLVFALFIPVPAVVSVLLSLTKWDLIGTIQFIGLENFRFLFVDDHVFLTALRNTLFFVVLSMALQLPLAFVLANILARLGRGRNLLRAVIFLPVTFSGVAVSLMFYFIFHPSAGPLNGMLKLIGFGKQIAWLADPRFALTAVIATLAWQWTGYHMVIYMAGIATIPEELWEAARIDGASEGQITRRIVFPLLLPVIQVSTILITTSSLKSFDYIFIMTFGGPNHASEVIASHMYTKTFAQLKYGYGSALSVLLLGLCVASTLLLNRVFRFGTMRVE